MTVAEVTTAGPKAPTRYQIYDTDLHHGVPSKDLLYPYLPPVHRERFEDYGSGGGGYAAWNGGVKGFRADALVDGKVPSFGGITSPSPDLARKQVFEDCGVDRALLTGGGVGAASAPDVDYGSALARAFNDYTVDHWLNADHRYRLAMALCMRDPDQAAKEIRRMAKNPQVVAIMMPGGAQMPYGQRFYEPIHGACAENDLVFAIHFGGEGSSPNPPFTAAGTPSYYVENRMARPWFYQVHVTSMIFEGVFEKFPNLKVAVIEAGFSWVPSYVWKLDQEWKALRHQTPWVKKLPSEYILDHVRFSSQPEDDPEPSEAKLKLLEWMHADRTLMFATDYPHWDWDDPKESLKEAPTEMRRRIMWDNAATFFRA